MTATSASTPIPEQNESPHDNLDHANRDCVGAHALLHERAGAAERFGVSRHTLWRFLDRRRWGKSLPRAVIQAVGDAFTDTCPLTAAAPG